MGKQIDLSSTLRRPKPTTTPTRGSTTDSSTAAQQESERGRAGERRALTVKLTVGDYKRLRLLAVEQDRTHQAICEEAITAYLNAHARQE